MRTSSMTPNAKTGASCHERQSSTGVADVKTFTVPKGTSAIILCAETTGARVTLDGSDPSAANAPSIVIPIGVAPVVLNVDSATIVKHCAAAAGVSVLQATYLL